MTKLISSSSYCFQLNQNLPVISITTVNPINFVSLKFSLSVNSLVIFLFSKYPFNFGYINNFCINLDTLGFAQVGENFDIDLSNYQGYYMLILIYPQGINLLNVRNCQIVPNLIMTFQNTLISPIRSETIINNYDSQLKSGFCPGYSLQSHNLGILCNNPNYVSIISLNDLNNQLAITTCQGFVYINSTTVGFVTPGTCVQFGTILSAEIVFIGDQNVRNFLNHNNIQYFLLPQTECQVTCKIIPCSSIYKIANLLTSPKKHSLISSKLWNEIVQDLYLTYNVFKYINYFTQFPYPQYIYPAIMKFYDFNKNFQPYPFISLLHAEKGMPLTVDEFNKLIDAILELANENTIQLQANLNKVHHDEIVSSSKFSNVIYDVNQFLTFNYNQYFLLDCYGTKFANLLNSISTFLTILISQPITDITIPSNTYIKNLLIYCNSQNIIINGSIVNFILNSNIRNIILQNYANINSFILNKNFGIIGAINNSNINILQINKNIGGIIISGNTNITTIQIQDNSGTIKIEDYAVVENLVCEKNSGTVNIASTAVVINNNCPSS